MVKCPDRVPEGRWRQAVEDAKAFVRNWGEQAHNLGWSNRDLFGLAPVPEKPGPGFDRLARYDLTGLIWCLCGRPVIALTETTAAIESPKTGSVTVYRKNNKPGYGPFGDDLADSIF